MLKILGIGAGYVGGPTMAMVAAKCPEYKVTVVDINAQRIAAWNSENLPIYEPGLQELVEKVRGKNLFFSTEIEDGIREADVIFVSVNTPTKTFGEGKGYAADLQYWEKTARQIRRAAGGEHKIVVEKSTVPVRTAEAMERILNENEHGIHYDVLSCPEFLAEGTAVRDLEEPSRVLIGGRIELESGRKAIQTMVDIFAHWVPRERILTSNVWSSELAKLAANAFLAQRVSSINAISSLCEKTEADIQEVARAIGMDPRIGDKFLNASVGFGGSCFKKDLLNLVYLNRYYGLEEAAEYWNWVVKFNTHQMTRFARNIVRQMFNTVSDKKIVLFGGAFKANTGDTRESPAITIAQCLLEERARVVISDPQAIDHLKVDLKDEIERGLPLTFEEDPYEAARDADAVAVVTEWDHFKSLDYKRIYDSMKRPAFIFDGRNILGHQELYDMGYHVFPIGKRPLSHFAEHH